MPNQDFYALYHSAWKLSEAKKKEAEESARLEKEAEEKARRQQKAGNAPPMSNRARMNAAFGGLNPADLQEALEDLE